MLGDIETLADFELFMQQVYKMNPDKTEEEIDDALFKGITNARM